MGGRTHNSILMEANTAESKKEDDEIQRIRPGLDLIRHSSPLFVVPLHSLVTLTYGGSDQPAWCGIRVLCDAREGIDLLSTTS